MSVDVKRVHILPKTKQSSQPSYEFKFSCYSASAISHAAAQSLLSESDDMGRAGCCGERARLG